MRCSIRWGNVERWNLVTLKRAVSVYPITGSCLMRPAVTRQITLFRVAGRREQWALSGICSQLSERRTAGYLISKYQPINGTHYKPPSGGRGALKRFSGCGKPLVREKKRFASGVDGFWSSCCLIQLRLISFGVDWTLNVPYLDTSTPDLQSGIYTSRYSIELVKASVRFDNILLQAADIARIPALCGCRSIKIGREQALLMAKAKSSISALTSVLVWLKQAIYGSVRSLTSRTDWVMRLSQKGPISFATPKIPLFSRLIELEGRTRVNGGRIMKLFESRILSRSYSILAILFRLRLCDCGKATHSSRLGVPVGPFVLQSVQRYKHTKVNKCGLAIVRLFVRALLLSFVKLQRPVGMPHKGTLIMRFECSELFQLHANSNTIELQVELKSISGQANPDATPSASNNKEFPEDKVNVCHMLVPESRPFLEQKETRIHRLLADHSENMSYLYKLYMSRNDRHIGFHRTWLGKFGPEGGCRFELRLGLLQVMGPTPWYSPNERAEQKLVRDLDRIGDECPQEAPPYPNARHETSRKLGQASFRIERTTEPECSSLTISDLKIFTKDIAQPVKWVDGADEIAFVDRVLCGRKFGCLWYDPVCKGRTILGNKGLYRSCFLYYLHCLRPLHDNMCLSHHGMGITGELI
ncbi:uncharacterized protein BDR25DRAFT_350338 [Lindgomyces ingoldianus]|uniref:Uncharacterized protein n=1 Tax=Lindgomyces ingoldianus TaxID=673940 RepID=A0ACB6R9X4_9PLEO|nr:uncharacterized protein BDR25DRAFT_350338 [Lindgomyces ingoldianus]KAF2476069.1 hypothetical protein BDR25DRAFT_350338 [Lindgomyces ingoldianus]